MTSYTIKATSGDDLRRFQLERDATYSQLTRKLSQLFSDGSAAFEARITWADEDGDAITVQSTEDWQECTAFHTRARGLGLGGGEGKVLVRLAVQTQASPTSPTSPTPLPEPQAEEPQAASSAPKEEEIGKTGTEGKEGTETETETEKEKETCHLTMIIDRSGSMQTLGDSVLSGIQAYLTELSAVDVRDGSETSMLFSTFDDKYKVQHSSISVKDAQAAITAADIEPRGMTALHDAIGYGLRDTQEAVAAMPTKPGKVVVFILTDGQENSSKKWNAKSIKKQIAKLEAAPYNYAFFFAAAGQDALDTGARLGLGADDCITWTPDRRATAATFGAVAEATTSHRRGMSKAFSPMHRASCYTTPGGGGGGGGGYNGHGRPFTYGPGGRQTSRPVFGASGAPAAASVAPAAGGGLFGVAGGLFGAAPATPARRQARGGRGGRGGSFTFGAPPAAAAAPAADPRGMGGSMRSPAPQADGVDPATQQQSAFAQSARSAALAKKWKKELAELSAMGLAAYADGLPELLEQTNGSIDEALDLLMA